MSKILQVLFECPDCMERNWALIKLGEAVAYCNCKIDLNTYTGRFKDLLSECKPVAIRGPRPKSNAADTYAREIGLDYYQE